MAIAELQVCAVEEADGAGGVCLVRVLGGTARAGQVYAAGPARLTLHRIDFVGGARTAMAHLRGPVVALLAPGQVLTYVPPGGHALEELEAWLATGPPLLEEPHPGPLRALAAGRMRDEALPDAVRLRWGRVVLAALARAGRAEEQPYVRSYLLQRFGPGRAADPDRDPAALCREVLARIDLTPAEAAAQARAWRDLPRPAIQRLRRIKGLIPCMAPARPYLAATDPLAEAVDTWSSLRTLLP